MALRIAIAQITMRWTTESTHAHVVHTNWPNALNRPEESVDGGGSTVAAPDGTLLLRLPGQASGIGISTLGESRFDWHPQA